MRELDPGHHSISLLAIGTAFTACLLSVSARAAEPRPAGAPSPRITHVDEVADLETRAMVAKVFFGDWATHVAPLVGVSAERLRRARFSRLGLHREEDDHFWAQMAAMARARGAGEDGRGPLEVLEVGAGASIHLPERPVEDHGLYLAQRDHYGSPWLSRAIAATCSPRLIRISASDTRRTVIEPAPGRGAARLSCNVFAWDQGRRWRADLVQFVEHDLPPETYRYLVQAMRRFGGVALRLDAPNHDQVLEAGIGAAQGREALSRIINRGPKRPFTGTLQLRPIIDPAMEAVFGLRAVQGLDYSRPSAEHLDKYDVVFARHTAGSHQTAFTHARGAVHLLKPGGLLMLGLDALSSQKILEYRKGTHGERKGGDRYRWVGSRWQAF